METLFTGVDEWRAVAVTAAADGTPLAVEVQHGWHRRVGAVGAEGPPSRSAAYRCAPARPGRAGPSARGILGRSQIGITMNIYSHVMPTQLVQAADAMNDVLWGERE
ncbi:hypothetical protein [Melissospora conviva]|uniref:hypothetical protein n=1 Tax=Melissospora conviva TaxID=3388432 RepID=UPI003C262B58